MFNVSRDEREVENCYRSYIVTKPTTSYVANSIIGCIVNLALCFGGTFLNALVIYVFWKTPKLRFKVSYFMIMVLSFNDVLVTLIVHPAFLINSIIEIVGRANCVYKAFYHVAAIVFGLMSGQTFFFMNVERYLSIVHPVFHLKHVTKRRCLIVCSVLWLPTIVLTPVVYVLNLKVQIIITIIALIVILGTCYIYISIFYIARKKKRSPKLDVRKSYENPANVLAGEESARTKDTALSDIVPEALPDREVEDKHSGNANRQRPLSNSNNKNTLECDTAETKPNKTITFLHDLQLAKIYLLVVFCNFVLYFPNALGLALFQDRVYTVNGLVQAKIWTATLALMNSTVNSLIFFWGNRMLKKEGWKVCKRLLRR